MAFGAHTGSMLTFAFIAARNEMRLRLIGARVDDPVLPESEPRRRSARRTAEQRAGKPVDGGRAAQRRAHVALVSPQASGRDEHLL
jgi:hypothetical protein